MTESTHVHLVPFGASEAVLYSIRSTEARWNERSTERWPTGNFARFRVFFSAGILDSLHTMFYHHDVT